MLRSLLHLQTRFYFLLVVFLLFLPGCGAPAALEETVNRVVPRDRHDWRPAKAASNTSKASRRARRPRHALRGTASWYGKRFQGRPTSSGEPFDRRSLTAAHRTLPFGTVLRVTSLDTGRAVTVRINDRGPVSESRIIDLSQAAAARIGLQRMGIGRVSLAVVKMGSGRRR